MEEFEKWYHREVRYPNYRERGLMKEVWKAALEWVKENLDNCGSIYEVEDKIEEELKDE